MNLNEQIKEHFNDFDRRNKINSSNFSSLNLDTAFSYLIFLQTRLTTNLQLLTNPDSCELAGTTIEHVRAEVIALSEVLNQIRIPGVELIQEHKTNL